MKTYSDYRAAARETLDGRWNEVAVMAFIVIILAVLLDVVPSLCMDPTNSWALGLSGMSTVIAVLLIGPLEYAMYNVLLSMKRDTLEDTPLASMVQMFTKDWNRYVVAMVMITIIVFIAALFTLGILGIILAYAYKMVPYLLRDYPELSAKEAMKMSREMMKGYKWDLFVLDLTFIGWFFLSILTFGIGFFWLTPYICAAEAHFYDDLKAEVIEEE